MSNGQPTHLDLFSGIGGFALAARWAGFRTIGFCEIDKYCQRVLAKNFLADNSLDGWGSRRARGSDSSGARESEQALPIFGDIRTLDGKAFVGVSLITGGFPCQPFSCAGKRRGAADDRALWPEMFRVVSEARPAWVLGENVAGIVGMELDSVLSDLEGIGYACRPFVIPACGVDARHRRNRVWIVAHAEHAKRRAEYEIDRDTYGRNGPRRCGESVPHAERSGLERQRQITRGTGTELGDAGDHSRWQPEPRICRVVNGLRNRMDRLKGLGNAIVPQVAYQILKAIRQMI